MVPSERKPAQSQGTNVTAGLIATLLVIAVAATFLMAGPRQARLSRGAAGSGPEPGGDERQQRRLRGDAAAALRVSSVAHMSGIGISPRLRHPLVPSWQALP
jgi:hypothetical protein